MTDSTLKGAMYLLGSVILLVAFYMQPPAAFTSVIAIHALAAAIPCSLGFVLPDLESRGITGFLAVLMVGAFGIAMAGIFATIMLSAGIVFVAFSIIVIVAVILTT